MSDIETRCNVYNRANGTNLTPKEYYKKGIDEMVRSEKDAVRDFGLTADTERNIKNKIMRKL